MAKKGNSYIHEMSYKKSEMKLYYEIESRCKLICLSGWLKEAAFEKLQRETNGSYGNTMQMIPENDNREQYNDKDMSDNVNLSPIRDNQLDGLLDSFNYM